MNLSQDQIEYYKNQINAATNADRITSILLEAKQLSDQSDFEEAQHHASIEISDVLNLNETQKSAYLNAISGAKTIAEINQVLRKARQDSDFNTDPEAALKKAKDGAIEEIGDFG